MENPKRKIFGVQFHPEVTHTENGERICCGGSFSMSADAAATGRSDRSSRTPSSGFADADRQWPRALRHQRRRGFHGRGDVGVARDRRSAGRRFRQHRTCCERTNSKKCLSMLQNNLHLNVRGVDASERFLNMLAGVSDPEKKRKLIGNEFIRVFEEEAQQIGAVDFLVQGTLYPDVIESVSVKGPSQTIKSHHNVGGLPERMQLKLVEPLARTVQGRSSARRAGAWSCRKTWSGGSRSRDLDSRFASWARSRPEGVRMLQEADDILISEIKKAGLYRADLAIVRRASAGEERRCDGRHSDLRTHARDSRRSQQRWHDGGLGSACLTM